MKNTVCCYWEDLGKGVGLQGLWVKAWQDRGWNARVLTQRDAERHLMYEKVKAHCMSLPTVNPPDYELSCYMRWLAAEVSGEQFFVDMDVFNHGLEQEDLDALDKEKVNVLILGGCPAAVYMPKGYEMWKWIMEYGPEDAVSENGSIHCSDMWMFAKLVNTRRDVFADVSLCTQYGDHDWESGKMVHYPTGATAPTGKSKVEVIKSCIPNLG